MSMFHVMHAVFLRDMRSRFFNHGIGFLVVSLWPLVHMLVLLLVNTAMGRRAPYGDDMLLFLTTGLIPTLAFMYVSRFMAMSLLMNRPMMAFPVVHAVDILLARAFLEIIAAAITLFLALCILIMLGSNVIPNDLSDAVFAYLATILFAIGMGILAGVLAMCFEIFITIYFILMILVYISSGSLFVLSSLPEFVARPLSWLPVVQSVEWMRVAYYPTYSSEYLDRSYFVLVGLCSLALGLALERIVRQRLME
ncbi:ABC transporter permease [Rhizobium lusitanum]|uniref:Capsular polysaccharide transport system permease protein n=1 Tax=Rhizobium lusitanum TaxID=293958 RepID=A0A7X0IU46_9HYPH|nr:capsular biosynthesis protein [Rhizobium lusitanum]MBB6486717.1 capsular polysaccharide transport system permease protein [Rhizobium lusitanum]